MNMSKKSGDYAEGCRELTFHHTEERVCMKLLFYLIIFFHDQKRDIASSVTWSKCKIVIIYFYWYHVNIKYQVKSTIGHSTF